MKTIAKIDERKFDEIETAVEWIVSQDLESAEVDIYEVDENKEATRYIESFTVSANDGYEFSAYGLFKWNESSEEYEWYNNTEILYNSQDEILDLKDKLEPGKYEISSIAQTLSEYLNDTVVEEFEV